MAVAIVDGDLRHRAKHEFSQHLEFRQQRKYGRHNAGTNNFSKLALRRCDREYPIRGFDQAPRESYALGLVAVQHRVRRIADEHGFQLPGKVDGVTDAGVHALASGRAVDMCGVAEQEGTPFPEMRRHAVVDAIGRKPVHLSDCDFEVLNYPRAHVFKFELIDAVRAFIPHRPDEPGASLSGQWKHGKEIRLVEIDMKLAIDRGT